ncbi:tissue-type plasminogen activator [Dicentrarchus labrax]|uniref:trypsin n=1 Tax=Dicentrarchus labrax TaxID=13489 RepID=A0A8C4DA14_DICLA|nr:tissue-type plasminogen activator [Dicentrarchus labrax]
MNLLVIVAVLAAFSVDVAFSRRLFRKILPRNPKDMCRSGDGSSYRGFVSESVTERRCLNWNRFNDPWGASEGLGNHNYCRNPNKSLMPWCRIVRGKKIVREFCDIPKCDTPTTEAPPAVDTELTCGERSERRQNKIVGGSFTPIESHPWVAAIFKGKDFLCGGSLISPCWVVTAAHCFSDSGSTRRVSVYLGKTAINETDADNEQSFAVEKLILHQKYNDTNYDNDIALLKIKGVNGRCAVKSPSTQTVCLPPLHTQLPASFQCSVAGFGNERYFGSYSQYLKQGEVKLISQGDCGSKLHYENLITKNMLCAGSPDWSTDACKGDSGGPLVCEMAGRMFLFGVVSWGEGCARKNKPGVYTQVTNYNKWIATKTGLSKYTSGVMYPHK